MTSLLLSVVFILGIASVAFGAWLIYQPAGLIVAGLAMVLVPVLYIRGSWVSSSG